MLRWLRDYLLTALIAIPAMLLMPFLAFWLCRTSWGGLITFWVGPWSACFYAVIAYNLVGSKFWRGRWSVLEWRERRGGYLMSVAKGTCWMFASLFFSYALELAYVFSVHPCPVARHLLPVVTYAPVLFTIIWSARG